MKPTANLLDAYQQQCQQKLIREDQTQLPILASLQKVADELLREQQQRKAWFAWLRSPKLISGLYLWGGVGIGKTFLMDCFYQNLAFKEKMRIHFHPFMQLVHGELKKQQGKKNPLQYIAKMLAEKYSVICLDEFLVTDITDAMLLRHLLKALFANGVCLVMTSNTEPDQLYKKGLQRPLFLPAIETIKKNMTVLHAQSVADYRKLSLEEAGVFFTPHNAAVEENLKKIFSFIAKRNIRQQETINILGRAIKTKQVAEHVVWFDFNVICSMPRSQADYIVLAQQFSHVLISDIPVIASDANNVVSLFIKLVDVFYDKGVQLIFSSATSIPGIYTDGKLLNDFKRTCSRLLEMQSSRYVSLNKTG